MGSFEDALSAAQRLQGLEHFNGQEQELIEEIVAGIQSVIDYTPPPELRKSPPVRHTSPDSLGQNHDTIDPHRDQTGVQQAINKFEIKTARLTLKIEQYANKTVEKAHQIPEVSSSKTVPFMCLDDYEACKKKNTETNGFLCAFALIACLGTSLVPFANALNPKE